MIKILIVDDNEKRLIKFVNKIKESDFYCYLDVTECKTADEARIVTRNIHFDLMILDVVLPKKYGNTPQASTGVKLLQDLNHNKRYLSPSKIIGITAHISDIDFYKIDFEKNISVVIKAEENSSDWINQIIGTMDKLVDTEIKKQNINKKSVLITIHGIRTGGDWQEDLTKLVKGYSSEFEFFSIKYGYFSLFAFLIPFIRTIKFNYISSKLEEIVSANTDKEIYIIAHSFGTYLVAKFLFENELNKKINLVIFSGSVLNKNYLIKSKIHEKVNKIINDCGTSDFVLIINKIFVWGLSDSGRIGFTNANSSSFCNRYFNGGHSLYFHKSFYENYWLPHIVTDNELEPINDKTKWHSDFSEFILACMEYCKYVVYILLIFFCCYNID